MSVRQNLLYLLVFILIIYTPIPHSAGQTHEHDLINKPEGGKTGLNTDLTWGITFKGDFRKSKKDLSLNFGANYDSISPDMIFLSDYLCSGYANMSSFFDAGVIFESDALVGFKYGVVPLGFDVTKARVKIEVDDTYDYESGVETVIGFGVPVEYKGIFITPLFGFHYLRHRESDHRYNVRGTRNDVLDRSEFGTGGGLSIRGNDLFCEEGRMSIKYFVSDIDQELAYKSDKSFMMDYFEAKATIPKIFSDSDIWKVSVDARSYRGGNVD
jgi:hypothetical protein